MCFCSFSFSVFFYLMYLFNPILRYYLYLNQYCSRWDSLAKFLFYYYFFPHIIQNHYFKRNFFEIIISLNPIIVRDLQIVHLKTIIHHFIERSSLSYQTNLYKTWQITITMQNFEHDHPKYSHFYFQSINKFKTWNILAVTCNKNVLNLLNAIIDFC